MSIQTTCSQCHTVLNIKEKYAGKRGSCPECGGPLVVPPLEQPAVTAQVNSVSGVSLATQSEAATAAKPQTQAAVRKKARSNTPPETPQQRADSILAELNGKIPSRSLTVGYRLGVVLTAAVMLLLPTIYVGLTVLVGWLFLYFLPVQLGTIEGRGTIKLYTALLLVGPILLFFLLKPLLARRSQYTESQPLDPKKRAAVVCLCPPPL